MEKWREELYVDALCHHGIKGQRWGVRRYQTVDGRLTSQGKKRYSNIAKGLVIGVGVAGAAAATAYALYNPKSRKVIQDFAMKSVASLSKTAKDAGKAMTDAAVASLGTIAIAKLTEKMTVSDDAPESVKIANKVALDTATAGLKTLTNTNHNSKSNSSNKEVGKEISEAIGKPSNKSINRSSSEYQALFKDASGNQRDQETRSTIKSMASAGYDIDQISDYLDKKDRGIIKHSGLDVQMYFYVMTGKDCLSSALYHRGIKGQRWGVRRYQNDDGTLTEAGKRRYSRQYESQMNKYLSDLNRQSTKIRIDAYNKTADDYNRYKIAEFNKRHKPEDSDYEEAYINQFNSDFEKAYNKALYAFASSNKHYQKGKAIADKYDLYSVNDLAAEQKRFIDGVDEYKRK